MLPVFILMLLQSKVLKFTYIFITKHHINGKVYILQVKVALFFTCLKFQFCFLIYYRKHLLWDIVKGIPSCQARKLKHKDTELTKCCNSSKLSFSTPPPPFPPTDMSIKSVSVLPLAQQRELLTAWNCRWMDTRKQDLHNSFQRNPVGKEGMRGPSERNLLDYAREDLVPKNIPHGGVGVGGVGILALPEDWAWGTEDDERAFPHRSAALKQRWGNNNAGGQESQTQDRLGLRGGGRSGDTTRATYFLEGG